MKAAIYCRVSTEDQERKGTSLQTQLEACLKYCQEKGYDILYNFNETYSGLSLERPELDKLRELVRANDIDLLVVYCLDRLSRDPTHGVILTQELEKHCVTLEAVTEDVDNSELGKLISYIRGYAAKLEAEKIRERTGRGREERIRSGKLPTRGSLYGYKYIKGRGTGQGIRIISENEAKWVRQWRDWILEDDQTLYAIILRMRALPVPPASGKGMWQISTIYNILTNPAIAGRTCGYRYSKTEKEHVEIPYATPAIISWEDYEAIQHKLAQNRSQSKRSCKLEYLLRGHIFCRYCGRRYRGKSKSIPKKDSVYSRYYQCTGCDYLVSPIKCKNKHWNADHLESQVWNEIRKLLLNPELVVTEAKRIQGEASHQNSFQQELGNVQARLKELDADQYNLLQFARKGFPDTLVEQENRKINDLRASLLQWKEEIELKKEKAVVAAKCLIGVEMFCELASQNLDRLTYEDKRLALEALAIKVWIDGDNVAIDGTIPVSEDGTLVSMTSNYPEM